MKKLITTIGIILLIVVVADTSNVIGDCVPPLADLISWWPGDGNANDIADENDGTLMGNATFAPGLVGQAFLLDGIDDFVDLGNASNLHVSTDDFTVDAWVNFTSLDNGGPCSYLGCDMSIVAKMYGFNAVNEDGWWLLKQKDDRFWFCLGGKDGNHCGDPAFTVFSQTVATTGVWYHVAVVKNSAGFSIYVNGVLEDSRSPLPDFLDSNSTNLLIGSNILEGANLNGLVDEVEIYNRALSQAEIQAIYNAGSAGKCTSPTLTVVKVGSGNCTVMSNPSGINCGDDCSESYPEDTEVTLSVSPDPGSVFGGWSGGGCSGIDECVVSMTTYITVTATCNLAAYTYEVTASVTGGHGAVTPPVQTITHGEPATINIDPDESYYIASITDNGIPQRIVNPYVILNVTADHTIVVTFEAHSAVSLVSPNQGEIFEPGSMIASYQPTFNWASSETFNSYTIKFSISSTDFKTRNILILSAKVSGTKYTWKPDLTSWLKMMKKSYNRGNVRDIYWKVIGKRLDGTEIESAVWGFQVGSARPVTLIDPPDTLDSGITPALSFNANCNVNFMLEFSPLADFSDPEQMMGFPSSVKDPIDNPVMENTLTWDQWTVVKKRLGAQGYFRVRAWDTINRETLSEIGSIQIYYFLVGNWDISGTETVRVVLDGQSEEGTFSVYDYFTFYLDRRKFSMINLKKGKWKELPNDKYTITFPYDYLASFFERQLEDQLGVNVNIRVTAFSMGGTEKRPEDTIKGKMSLKMSIDIPYYDASGTISDYITYTGYRMSAGYQLDSQETLLRKSPLGETLGQYLREMLSDR
jgi:hypothetical protein